jgi:hypothetical protein
MRSSWTIVVAMVRGEDADILKNWIADEDSERQWKAAVWRDCKHEFTNSSRLAR